jgi:hypothetical protein
MASKIMVTQKDIKRLLYLVIFYSLVIVFSFSSCLSRKKYSGEEHELYIFNTIGDTLFFSRKYKSGNINYFMLLPYKHRLIGTSETTIVDNLREVYEDYHFEISIYKLACDTCEREKICDGSKGENHFYYINPNPLISWNPPLVSLPDSIHSFYNINSWEIHKGGKNNKYDIATFTITKKDLKQIR